MTATALEFRLRFWILVAIFVLGFTAPWDHWLRLDGTGPNTHLWGRMAIGLSRGGMNISVAFNLILALGIAGAFAGAALRTWASACLGPEAARGRELNGEQMVVTGPYRFVRNPLSLGSWLNALALALLMPLSGAIFTLVLVAAFEMRLIVAEESSLTESLGQAYREYCARVPRLIPRLRAKIATAASPASRRGHWGMAALAEVFLWGTAVSFAAVGWQYNAHLLIQCVLVSLGLSLVARGATMQSQPAR